MIVRADADDERTALPRTDDAPGLARRDRGDRIGAVEFRDGQLHRAQQVAAARRRANAHARDAR